MVGSTERRVANLCRLLRNVTVSQLELINSVPSQSYFKKLKAIDMQTMGT